MRNKTRQVRAREGKINFTRKDDKKYYYQILSYHNDIVMESPGYKDLRTAKKMVKRLVDACRTDPKISYLRFYL